MRFVREEYIIRNAVDRFFGTRGGFPRMLVRDFNGKETLVPDRDQPNLFEELALKGLMICGGAITSVFTASKINDLDFYMTESVNEFDCKLLIERYFGPPVLASNNALTYKRKEGTRVYTIQLITRFVGTPSEIFDWFDFTITHGAYLFNGHGFVFGDRYFADLARRELIYAGSSAYPICAMYRTKKYQERGFKLSGATIMHIALCIVQLEIENYSQLKEQLMGIDTMFLQGLLASKEPNAPVVYGEFLDEAFKCLNMDTGNTTAEDDEHV